MTLTQRRHHAAPGVRVGACIACALILLTIVPAAVAIAPSVQRTDPVMFDKFFSVVDLVNSPTNDIGTGSVIGKIITPDQIGYFCVLTAAHNFPASTGIAFGYWGDGTNPANSFANTYPITHSFTGGSTGRKDLAVAGVRYGQIDPFFVSVKDLSLWSPSPINTDADLINVITNDTFTEVGYGYTATRSPAAGAQTGWSPVIAVDGIQRFQNNTVTGGAVNAVHGAFTYTEAQWTTHFPTVPNSGEGSSFQGDSGGPYLMLDEGVQKTINGLLDISGAALPAQTINLFSDSIFAVHTFGSNNNPQPFGSVHGGVLLNAADIAWIQSVHALIPEPSSLALLGIGWASLMAFRRKRR